ncbi:uncharacterized protein C22orf46-like [Diceros bicornis minor]|uniref:uncharacterized protein C22orf46-like n=1 Tax=Diceros bicornis minor TaxID=77932 RepID=UPI0026ED12E9|nr:uncharacterized protein C22orf46-like [Diceros bicornis minor]
MLLPLLGACAVVGPFHGPEWEPVQDLLSEDRSCRDPRCCGNLLILCLFLIWQVRHYWHQATRTHLNMKKVIKVPPQKWAVPSRRHNTCFGLTPEFFSPGKFRGLDAHVQQWAQKKRWEYQRSLQESWAKYLLSWQHLCQDSPWDFYTPSEPIFCTASFSSTFMLPQDSSWEAWKVPWCLSDDQTHLICKPLPPALDMYQRMKQLLVHSQEALVPLEHVVSMRSHPASMTLITTLPNLPSAQRLQFCSREFLPVPSNQQVGMPIWKSWGCPQEAWGTRESAELRMLTDLKFLVEETRTRLEERMLLKVISDLTVQRVRGPQPSLAPDMGPRNKNSHAPQAATALVGDPTALTVLPKWPVLKKSQQLLLESLMRRKIAHLKWGLPQQILESYVLSNFLEPCPLPLAEGSFKCACAETAREKVLPR